MAKRFVDSELFNDPWYMEISLSAKVLWLYFITNCDHAGILKFNKKLCEFQTGIKNIEPIITEMSSRLKKLDEQYFFIPKYIKFQYPNFPQSNVRQQQGAIKRLIEFGLFDEKKGTLNKELETLNKQSERVNNSYGSDNDSVNGSVKKEGINLVSSNYSEDFDIFWKNYPRRIGKGAAFKAWKKLQIEDKEKISSTLKWQIESEQWKKDNGQFIPHPSTYLNQRRWEDERTTDNRRGFGSGRTGIG